MQITEVRVKLVSSPRDKLRAFCSITIDDLFVVRDLKVIEGQSGAFVAMPSRKRTVRCDGCRAKNPQLARFCNECGRHMSGGAATRGAGDGGRDSGGRGSLHTDVAHPINAECRALIQGRVLEVFYAELERSKDPDFEPMSLDPIEERPGPTRHGGKFFGEEFPEEPEDNFGAGLFS